MSRIATLSLHHFTENRFWAFKQMRLGLPKFQKETGRAFCKFLGTGGGNGFSIFPDFGRYAILSTWTSSEEAEEKLKASSYFGEYVNRTSTTEVLHLKPTFGHGSWEEAEPFQYQTPTSDDLPLAVITRATIKPSRLHEFWQYVPAVSKSMVHQPGLELAMGIGELPLIQQATFSIWDSWDSMKSYAYKQRGEHELVIKKTRERGWYKEELFARFQVTARFRVK